MKTLFKLGAQAAIALAISGNAIAVDIDAGPIWNNDDAKAKCPAVCSGSGLTWNGNWKTTVQGQMSVCGCDQPASNTSSASIISAMANNQSLSREQFVSMNGYRLQVNPDGNLCLFAETGPNPHRWCVNDEIGEKYAQIERVAFEDGVLSAYDANKAKLWSTRPVSDPYAKLTITTEGRLVITSASGALYWQNK